MKRIVLLAFLPLLAANAGAESPSYKGKMVLFGNLHAHSKLSDDVRDPNNEMSPLQAFTFAGQNGVDFLAISDHHKATDSNHRIFMTASEYDNQLFDVADTFNDNKSSPRVKNLVEPEVPNRSGRRLSDLSVV